MSENKSGKTPLGLDENIEGLLCYALTWVTGIIFLIIEKENRFVKFHALQSIITFLPLTIASYIISIIPVLGSVISTLLNILMFVLWLILIFKAYNHELYKLPVAGDIAEQQLSKM